VLYAQEHALESLAQWVVNLYGIHNFLFCYRYHSLIFSAFEKLRKMTKSFIISLCPSALSNSTLIQCIFLQFDICVFFENLLRKFKFHYNLTRIRGTLYENLWTFMIISHWILLRLRNVSDKSFREIKTYFMSNNFFSDNCAVDEIMWKNMVDPKRPQII
jgi:hypothetical protein